MSNVNTDSVSLSIADEEAGPPYGVLPGSPIWSLLEPNALSKFGAETKTTPRTPISKNLQRSKGKLTDLDSGVSFQADLTMEHLARLLPGSLFATFTGPGNLADGDVYRPSAVTATGYTVADDGDLPDGVLIYASGFADPVNNGIKLTAGTSTTTEIKTPTTNAEASIQDAQNATVAVAGFQAATTDLAIDADGNLTSGGGGGPHIDFTDAVWGLEDGQWIWVGGGDAGTFFGTAADRGLARIAKGGIAAAKLTLEKKATTFATDAGTGKTIQVFFGRFCCNVARDDPRYLFRTHMIEAVWADLGGAGTDEYSYAKGNLIDQMQIELPLSNKAGISMVMVGTDTEPPTVSRADAADDARQPVQIDSFNTSSEILRLRATLVDETPLTVDMTSATLSVKNNVSPKKVLAYLGAKYLNRGFIEGDLETDVLFTSDDVLAVIRQNITVTAEGGFRNADAQGFVFDLPSCVATGGDPSLPSHDQVSLKVTFGAFRDVTFGYSISFSLFPYLPDPADPT
jgi:hypothetical protein